MTYLELTSIHKAFGQVEVLRGISLGVPSGSVLALLGENGAGKSTLMKIISGEHKPTSGEIKLNGRSYTGFTPIQAKQAGVRMIAQELNDAADLGVAENISLGMLPSRAGFVRRRAMRARAATVLRELGTDLDLDAPSRILSLGQRQVLEIARAIVGEADVLIFDEPTAALSARETARLFETIARLKHRGTAILYITHRLDEIAQIADFVHVLRDGSSVLEGTVQEIDRDRIVEAMIGRDIGALRRPAPIETTGSEPRTALESRGVTVHPAFSDLNFSVRYGEILAFFGKLGSGIEDVPSVAFGLKPVESGELLINGEPVRLAGAHDAIGRGIGLVPGDRKRQGIFTARSVAENLAAPSWPRLARWRMFITQAIESRTFRKWHQILRIKSTDNSTQHIEALSGGNQQKVLLGRWLEQGAKILLLSDPTRGVDVGARDELYAVLRDTARAGTAVLVATSDYEEVVQVADRAIVMADGEIVCELSGDEITNEALIEAVSR